MAAWAVAPGEVKTCLPTVQGRRPRHAPLTRRAILRRENLESPSACDRLWAPPRTLALILVCVEARIPVPTSTPSSAA